MKTDPEIIAYIQSHPNHAPARIAHNLKRHGITGEKVRALWGRAKVAQTPASIGPTKAVVRVKLKSLDEFRRAHDNPQKIRTGLEGLTAGSYLTEEEFRVFCNIPAQLWRRNADLPEFSDNRLRHAGVVYWAAKTTIEEMKTIIGAA